MFDRILLGLLLASLFYIEVLETKVFLLFGVEWNPILRNIGPDWSMIIKIMLGVIVSVSLVILGKKLWIVSALCIMTIVILWNLIMLVRLWK